MSEDGEIARFHTSSHHATSDGRFNENLYFSAEFDEQLKTQRSNILIAGGFTFVVFAVGIISTWYLIRTGSGGMTVEYMRLGPMALSCIALPFPLKMYLSYRVRSPIYRGYKRLFEEAAARDTVVESSLVEDARAALKALHKLD